MPNEAKCKRPSCNAPGDLRLGDYCSTECEIYHLDEIEINELKAEVKRLRVAIQNHRARVIFIHKENHEKPPRMIDHELWEVLDA